jgi:uncharacterized membrane protein YtjA (UPF0391 family)
MWANVVSQAGGTSCRLEGLWQADHKERFVMIRLAIISLVIAAVLAILGFGGAAGTFVGIAKILFFIAVAIFALFLVLGLLAGKGIKNALD